MTLDAKLTSIPKQNVVQELDIMLDNASVSISWYGERLTSVQGYTGVVEINQIVSLYLSASPKREDGYNNLKERLEFYHLWNKVKALCKNNTSLNDTWIYTYLVPVKEIALTLAISRPIDFLITPLKGTKFPSRNEWCFSFYPQDFKCLWPNTKPFHESRGLDGETWIATKELVEEYISKNKI